MSNNNKNILYINCFVNEILHQLFYLQIPHEFQKDIIPIGDMPSLVKEVSLLLSAYFQAPF